MQEGSWVIHLFSKVSFESTKKDIVSAKEVVDDRDSSNSSWVASAVHNCQKFCLSEILQTKTYIKIKEVMVFEGVKIIKDKGQPPNSKVCPALILPLFCMV